MTYWGNKKNLPQAEQVVKLFHFAVYSGLNYSIVNFMFRHTF